MSRNLPNEDLSIAVEVTLEEQSRELSHFEPMAQSFRALSRNLPNEDLSIAVEVTFEKQSRGPSHFKNLLSEDPSIAVKGQVISSLSRNLPNEDLSIAVEVTIENRVTVTFLYEKKLQFFIYLSDQAPEA